jgi:hypothetical protein
VSAARKLFAFAAALALVFVGAAVAGGAIGPNRDNSNPKEPSHAAMEDGMSTDTTSGAEHAADSVRGVSVSDDDLTLSFERSELRRGRPTELRFAIVGRDGRPVRDFAVEHERRMHFIVVRRDGQGFQHLHPRMDSDGTWHVRLALPEAGSYRAFADFKRGGTAYTLAADLAVDGSADYRPLPAPARTADTGDGYRVRLDGGAVRAGRDAELRFTVTRAGQVVHTEPYLGAGGHLVALREGDLASLHVHPADHGRESDSTGTHDDAALFMTEFPSAGRYRLYLQFKHDGRVHTAAFTQEVSR